MKTGLLPACLVLPLVSLAAPSAAHTHDATLCGILQTTRQFRQAISHCGLALSVNPNNVEVLSNRGSAHLSLGDFDLALADFSKAIEKRPEDASNYFNRALAHAAKQQHHDAIADYSKAIELMPGLAIAYNNRASQFELLGDRDKAIADYRKALTVAPSLKPVIEQNLRRLGVEP